MPQVNPMISIIVAMSRNRTIGSKGQIPWHFPDDLKRFKTLTMGKPMIMGRKTWESLPGLLPGRKHTVITRQADYEAKGATVVHSLQEAIMQHLDAEEIMVIGGQQIYAQAMGEATRIYLTVIQKNFEGDTAFPPIDATVWRTTKQNQSPLNKDVELSAIYFTMERR